MARKSKADSTTSAKVGKVKSRSPSGKPRKSSSKRLAVEKLEPEAAPIPVTPFDPTNDQISMRAYFISERRRRLDIPGDANSDWLEAKRQLLAEVRR